MLKRLAHDPQSRCFHVYHVFTAPVLQDRGGLLARLKRAGDKHYCREPSRVPEARTEKNVTFPLTYVDFFASL
jgi:hypothetical protein